MKRLRLWILLLPYLLHYFGAFLNLLVITVNHGQMPVAMPPWIPVEELPFKHCVMTHETHLNFIADWIMIWWNSAVWSPGDVFIELGDWIEPFCLGAWAALLLQDFRKRY